MALIDRIGVVIPGGSADPAGDARRLESLGFDHALLPHEAPAPALLALGATRNLRLVVREDVLDLLGSTPGLPSGALDRLAVDSSSKEPLRIEPTDAGGARAEILARLSSCAELTLDVGVPHAAGVRALALNVLDGAVPGGAASLLFAEDLAVGQVFELGEHQLSEDDIVSFAERFDPLDFHIDPDLASASPLGVLCASGIHTQAIMQRLSARALHRRLAVVAGRGMLGMRLRKPVTPGMVLEGSTEVLDIRMRPHGRAVLTVRSTLRSSDELVLEQTGEMVVLTRGAGQEQ